MGGSLQRLEVLLVGLVLVCAGAVVAMLLVLRPPAPAASIQTTPQPIAVGAAQPTQVPIAPPAALSAPLVSAPSQTTDAPLTEPLASPHVTVPVGVTAAWPWLLLSVGLCGLALVVLRRRSRRLGYTNRSVQQLFAASDRVTHASNMQIVRDLAERGLLTPELAAATGVDHDQPKPGWMGRLLSPRLLQLTLPRFTRLKVKLPSVNISRLRLPHRPPHASTGEHVLEVLREQPHAVNPVTDTPAIVTAAAPAVGNEVALVASTAPAHDLGIAASVGIPVDIAGVAPRDVLAAHVIDFPEAALPIVPFAEAAADGWTAEDRVLAVAGILAEVWAAHALRSPILALDTASTPGSELVTVTLDVHTSEEEQIDDLSIRIVERHPSWRAAWRRQLLEVVVTADGVRPPVDGPLVFPALAHGRGKKLLRFYPLAAWRHLGVYGGDALGTLHAILGNVLFAQSPTNIALAILDAGEITPLYREVPHLVVPPGSAHETLALLAQTIRRGAQGDVRPLLLVVVEPDDALLDVLLGIVARLQARPNLPVHLFIVQEQLRSAGRELYALLPALLTSGGSGPTTLLPGQGAWPLRGEARLVGRGMRIEGHVIRLDEAAIVAQLAQVRGWPGVLPPVLWDDIASGADKPTASVDAPEEVSIVDVQPYNPQTSSSRREEIEAPHNAVDDAAQRQRIASVMTARRQALIDAEAEPAALAASSGTQDVPDDSFLPGVDTDALASDATALEGASLASGADTSQPTSTPVSMAEPAPHFPASRHDVPDGPPQSRRAALLLATLDAGTAADMPLSLVASRHESYAATPPPQAPSPSPTTATPVPMVEPDNGWPIGPAPLGRIAMADLLARVVATPAIIAGQANELGVTKNRIIELLKGAHKAQAKELAEILLAWFDLAGLLVEPTKPGRLRHPRALVTTNLAEIAARLQTTPCPDKGTVKRLWAESNEGKS
jgi:hypothetical protein